MVRAPAPPPSRVAHLTPSSSKAAPFASARPTPRRLPLKTRINFRGRGGGGLGRQPQPAPASLVRIHGGFGRVQHLLLLGSGCCSHGRGAVELSSSAL